MLLRAPDQEHLQRWFRHRFPHARDLVIRKMRRAFPGLSRETWFIDTAWDAAGGAHRERFVLRTQLPGNVSLAPKSLQHEARIYEALQHTPLPVPRYVGYEDSPEWLLEGERAFFVRGWVEGVLEPANLRNPDPAYDSVRIDTAKELVAKLALLHSLDWKALGIGAWMPLPADPGGGATFVLDDILEDYRRHRLDCFPALVDALLSMREAPPSPPSRLVLVKENCGLGDEVWADHGVEITAMCDWETARIADPAVDISMVMRSTGWCWNLEAILDYYEELTGERISRDRVDFYMALRQASSIAVLNGRAVSQVRSGKDRRIQLLSIGLIAPRAASSVARLAGF